VSQTLDIKIDQGSDYVRVLTLKVNNVLLDLTGYTFRGQIRKSFGAQSTIAEFDFTVRDQVTDTGKVDWTLPNSATIGLPIKTDTDYLYDVEMENADGIVTRLFQGTVTIRPEITR
jgi:hypothetical protein